MRFNRVTPQFSSEDVPPVTTRDCDPIDEHFLEISFSMALVRTLKRVSGLNFQ